MTTDVYQILNEKFGYQSFKSGQQEIIEAVLNKEDVIGILPTGMGKSLCYQLPGYMMPHPIIIISPLVSLMQDQVEQMKLFGEKKVVAFNSFLLPNEKQQILHQLPKYKFIFISPEMFMQPKVLLALKRTEISLIVADEAHCISQWGYDFRPDYLRIGEAFHNWDRPPVLALTATATTQVIDDISRFLHLQNPSTIIQSLDRPNIRYKSIFVETVEEKYNKILNQIQSFEGPGIIYTQSRKKADEYALKLKDEGFRVASYHAGMEPMDRTLVQQQFGHQELDWVCATNAFGMGVHKSNIRQVIHDHIPSSIANYSQEVGRAGRDGKDAIATLFYSNDDEDMTVFISTNDFPDRSQINLYSKQENPKDLVNDGIISETTYRILSYWLEKYSEAETVQIMENLRHEKIRQIYLMKDLLTNEQCLRNQLVSFFGQVLSSKPLHCCSVCGINDKELLKPMAQQRSKDKKHRWNERLSLIFNREL
ncbi:MAG: ATP-dependent DNA helicase RecQ [Paenisporosarcina sp.]